MGVSGDGRERERERDGRERERERERERLTCSIKTSLSPPHWGIPLINSPTSVTPHPNGLPHPLPETTPPSLSSSTTVSALQLAVTAAWLLVLFAGGGDAKTSPRSTTGDRTTLHEDPPSASEQGEDREHTGFLFSLSSELLKVPVHVHNIHILPFKPL